MLKKNQDKDYVIIGSSEIRHLWNSFPYEIHTLNINEIFFLLIIQKRTTFYYWHKLQTSTVHFFETSEAKIPKLGMYYKLTLDKSISKPGTLPDIRLVSPSYAGTTPKLVKAAKFSLPSYKSSSPCSVQVNLCRKLLFLHQLTQNMTTDCSWNYEFSSWNYEFSTWKLQAQNMFCPCMFYACSIHVLNW